MKFCTLFLLIVYIILLKYFVAISNATHAFEEVDKESLLNFIDEFKAGNSGNKIWPDGLIHIEHIVKFRKFDPDAKFCKNSVMISLGSCWGIPDLRVSIQ